MNNFQTIILLLFSISSISQEKVIINPVKEIGLNNWRIVNDNVMGGVSKSDLYLNENKNLIFSGEVSLDYNGGFASCRHSLEEINLEGVVSFRMRIKGDGKTYKFRLSQRNRSINYSSNFQTKKNKWIDVEIFINDLSPTFMGYYSRSSPKIKIENMNSIGFLISDKQEGEFSLEIKNVKAIK